MNVNDTEFNWLMACYYHSQFVYYYNLQFHIAGVNTDPYERRDIREWSEGILDDIWEKSAEYERQYRDATYSIME